ncbi:MAG: hypothetical protein M3365_03020, partial [Gemmatimonadota bacterium]|nr:hypothetical protein [Gemmatimonadota bacterium]
MNTLSLRVAVPGLIPFMSFRAAVVLATGSVLWGCSLEHASAPDDFAASLASNSARVSVCHVAAANAEILEVSAAALDGHLRHGDYVARMEVGDAGTADDGVHYGRVTDALAAARAGRIERGELEAAACRITIAVAAGDRRGSTAASSDPTFERFPFFIDVPDITLKGALSMGADADSRATGLSESGEVTTFIPVPALVILTGSVAGQRVSESIITVNSRPEGSKGDGVVIEGFAFQSGRAQSDPVAAGQAIMTMRARGLVVRGNTFGGGFSESVSLRATSALVERNHLSGVGQSCDICLAGPGDFAVRDNRVLGPGGVPGIFLSPVVAVALPPGVETYTLPATAFVTADISNNEVRGHRQVSSGVG